MCTKKEEDEGALWTYFSKKTKRNFLVGSSVLRLSLLCSKRRSEKQKNAPKNLYPHYPKVSWVSPNKKATTLTHGEQPSTLVQSTARGNPLSFFCLDARARESERETFSSSGVALERSAFISIPFRSPPNTSRGVQIFNRNADDASGRALAR